MACSIFHLCAWTIKTGSEALINGVSLWVRWGSFSVSGAAE